MWNLKRANRIIDEREKTKVLLLWWYIAIGLFIPFAVTENSEMLNWYQEAEVAFEYQTQDEKRILVNG